MTTNECEIRRSHDPRGLPRRLECIEEHCGVVGMVWIGDGDCDSELRGCRVKTSIHSFKQGIACI